MSAGHTETSRAVSVGIVGIVAIVCATTLIFATGRVAAAAGAQAGGDAGRGEQRFEECAACHSVVAGENGVGPSLHGIINRKAASLEDFRYSAAMKASDIVWTAQTLDEFVADPQKLVPANRMAYAGLPDAGDRADLIAYLQQATR